MTAPTLHDPPRSDVPHALVLVTATLGGVLAAIAAQILLAQRGIDLTGALSHGPGRGLSLRAASAWWITGGVGLVAGALIAGALSRCPVPWTGFRALRWLAGAAIVFGLAHVGHSAAGVETHGPAGVAVLTTLAALSAAALMAGFGGYFAARR